MIALDHLALAVERQRDAFPMYARDLGGEWKSGGSGPGFAPCQLEYRGGMKIELLEPHRVDTNDFLRRFLDQRGPGPHHLTFKLPDIRDAIARCESAGVSPINVDLRDPEWQEAFLHPKSATGIVVQLAQSSGGEWKTPEPAGFPNSRVHRPAALVRIVHLVPSLDDGLAVFERLLDGRRTGEGDGWVELAWPVDGRLRLVAAPDALHGAPGRIGEIVFSVDAPSEVAGAEPADHGAWVVSVETNLGTQLRLLPTELGEE